MHAYELGEDDQSIEVQLARRNELQERAIKTQRNNYRI
jgi:hypothetical protein